MEFRRYPRVIVGRGIQNFSKLTGIEVFWPDQKKTGVIDISFIGASVISHKEPAWDLSKGQILNLTFHFIEQNKKEIFKCEVVRQDDRCTAFSFHELSVEANKLLKVYLDPKLVASQMKLVDSKYYIKEQGFDYWYHGPNMTNIFIWGDKKRIKRWTIELDSQVLSWEDNQYFESKSSHFLYAPTEDYAHQVNNPDEKTLIDNKNIFIKKIISFLNYVPDSKSMVQKILEQLSKV